MDALSEGMGGRGDSYRRYDRHPGVVPPIHVEIIDGPGHVSVTRQGPGADGKPVYDPDVELVSTGGRWIPLAYYRGDDYRIAAVLVHYGVVEWNPAHAATITDLAEAFLDELRATQWPLVLTRRI
ncbi:MAG: hypothetical protein KC501_21730 [Myxococcales bacterium]|nr:hypothetical protein [Myxococcales bacterium]